MFCFTSNNVFECCAPTDINLNITNLNLVVAENICLHLFHNSLRTTLTQARKDGLIASTMAFSSEPTNDERLEMIDFFTSHLRLPFGNPGALAIPPVIATTNQQSLLLSRFATFAYSLNLTKIFVIGDTTEPHLFTDCPIAIPADSSAPAQRQTLGHWIRKLVILLTNNFLAQFWGVLGFPSLELFQAAHTAQRRSILLLTKYKPAMFRSFDYAMCLAFVQWWHLSAEALGTDQGSMDTLLLLLPRTIAACRDSFDHRQMESGGFLFSLLPPEKQISNVALWMSLEVPSVNAISPVHQPHTNTNNNHNQRPSVGISAPPTEAQLAHAASERVSTFCQTCKVTGHNRFSCPRYSCKGCGAGPSPSGVGHIWRVCPTHPGGPIPNNHI